MGDSIGLIMSIVLAVVYQGVLKNKIRQNKNFDGLLWGLLVGLTTGLLFAMMVYTSTTKELDALVNKQDSSKKQKATRDIDQLKKELFKGVVIGFTINAILIVITVSLQFLSQN